MCHHETTDRLESPEAGWSETEIDRRVEDIVGAHPAVLFMKGSPEAPRCGFSAATLKLLQRYEMSLHTVDVLADAALRDAIKTYADWPTIPQLYVGGRFVGGFDIVRAMHREGSLAALLGADLRQEVPA